MQLIYVLQVLATFAFGGTKLSIVYFYRRIFCPNGISPFLSKATWGVIIFLYLWILGFLIGFIFDCGLHFWANWGPLINDYSYCYSTFGLTAGYTITDVASDFVVILLPIRTVNIIGCMPTVSKLTLTCLLVWKLQMSLSQKIAIICIFLLGTL